MFSGPSCWLSGFLSFLVEEGTLYRYLVSLVALAKDAENGNFRLVSILPLPV